MDFRFCLLVSMCFVAGACQRETPTPVAAPQPVVQQPTPTSQTPKTVRRIENPRYRLYKTQNIFTLLLLDTRTGQLSQVQYTLNEKKSSRAIIPISDDVLA